MTTFLRLNATTFVVAGSNSNRFANFVVLLSFKMKSAQRLCVEHIFVIEKGADKCLSSPHVMAVIPKTMKGFFTISDCYFNFHIFGTIKPKLHPVLIKKQYNNYQFANNILITTKQELYIAGSNFFVKFVLSFK